MLDIGGPYARSVNSTSKPDVHVYLSFVSNNCIPVLAQGFQDKPVVVEGVFIFHDIFEDGSLDAAQPTCCP
jgi:hypothetical protein